MERPHWPGEALPLNRFCAWDTLLYVAPLVSSCWQTNLTGPVSTNWFSPQNFLLFLIFARDWERANNFRTLQLTMIPIKTASHAQACSATDSSELSFRSLRFQWLRCSQDEVKSMLSAYSQSWEMASSFWQTCNPGTWIPSHRSHLTFLAFRT